MLLFLIHTDKDTKKIENGPPSVRQRNDTRMSFRWLANGGPTLYVGWVKSLAIFPENTSLQINQVKLEGIRIDSETETN